MRRKRLPVSSRLEESCRPHAKPLGQVKALSRRAQGAPPDKYSLKLSPGQIGHSYPT